MTIKNPQSLRQKSVAPIAASSGLGLFAACVIGTTSAIAQTETTLPVMNVEAPAIAKPKPKPRRGTTNTTTRNNTAQATEASAQDVAPSQGESARKPNANPNADARAPYKVNQSGSSKLTEPLLNTPRSVTAIPKEVMEDKGVTSARGSG